MQTASNPLDDRAAAGADSQSALWNGAAGQAWVAEQQTLDTVFRPFEALLVAQARSCAASEVLDVGCGTGSTTLALAGAAGQQLQCTGIDISQPMIDCARQRAQAQGAAARFVVADAQTHAFAPAAFDLVVSRFGVMFFADPVQAFANLRRATRPGGALSCIVWRSPQENPFMTTAERAVAHLLPALAPRRRHAPGQFAFADPDHVQSVLEQGGWCDVRLQALDVDCTLPAAALPGYFSRMGPVGLALKTMDGPAREPVLAALQQAFAPYVAGDEARFGTACWMVSAQCPG